ncbi:hypothetical protein FQU71_10400 [Legionella longbeachae]|nr:hypothetical protein FQU71_10400 [Legionella longbeachae]
MREQEELLVKYGVKRDVLLRLNFETYAVMQLTKYSNWISPYRERALFAFNKLVVPLPDKLNTYRSIYTR